ncbi:hypothetical protein CIB48_g10903 [Xylaria polymorpha]|nr:hypothetical protein CIB48_g10903 [Xylaria polymorpha]
MTTITDNYTPNWLPYLSRKGDLFAQFDVECGICNKRLAISAPPDEENVEAFCIFPCGHAFGTTTTPGIGLLRGPRELLRGCRSSAKSITARARARALGVIVTRATRTILMISTFQLLGAIASLVTRTVFVTLTIHVPLATLVMILTFQLLGPIASLIVNIMITLMITTIHAPLATLVMISIFQLLGAIASLTVNIMITMIAMITMMIIMMITMMVTIMATITITITIITRHLYRRGRGLVLTHTISMCTWATGRRR